MSRKIDMALVIILGTLLICACIYISYQQGIISTLRINLKQSDFSFWQLAERKESNEVQNEN